MKSTGILSLFTALLIAPLGAARGQTPADAASQLQSLVAKNAPAIVTIQLVLKTEVKAGGQARDSEERTGLEGVVVSPNGLIMISDAQINPKRLQDLFGGMGAEGMDMKTTPTDIKVVVEREEKEYDAFLAATDTNLGLAFLKIEGLGDRKLTAVDFSNTAAPVIGQPIVLVTRLDKGFDYAPFFKTARISGEVTKPRQAWLMDQELSDLGLPVFSPSGDVVGVLTTLTSGIKAESPDLSMGIGMMMRMFGGGGGQSLFHVFVVPGPPVMTAIAEAKQRAVAVAAERAKAKASAPTTPAKPSTPAKPGGGGKPTKP
ncbi:MAG TPA: serine protease [Chthonomonadaceae bacterium]|nr:serine protease [Chthonomonadaceae bacterium]